MAIAGAEVVLTPRNNRTVTDAAGEFRFDGVTAGPVVLHVRRIGFAAESLGVELPLVAPIDIELREAAQPLDTVSVTGREATIPRGKLTGFHERKHMGIGRFLEEADIEKLGSRRLADILVARIPGLKTVRSGKGGSATYIGTVRMAPRALLGAPAAGGGSSVPGSALSTRGPRVTACFPDVYLDGAVVYSSGSEDMLPPGMSADAVLFDVNSVNPTHVAAIEFYAGAAQMPAQYNRTGSACGALLIWTK